MWGSSVCPTRAQAGGAGDPRAGSGAPLGPARLPPLLLHPGSRMLPVAGAPGAELLGLEAGHEHLVM